VVCLVKGGFAAAARVHACVGVVLIVGAGAGRLGAFLAENAELLYAGVSGDAAMTV
jgi:hypothetical protein